MRTFVRALTVLVSLSCCASLRVMAREISLDERVDAQRAIERVYYAHQDGATLAFHEAVPDAVLKSKVRDYLQKSAALEQLLGKPIFLEMLQAEETRVARDSKLRERLREIYDALGNDPLLIRECFIRPSLVERLSGTAMPDPGKAVSPSSSQPSVENLANCNENVWESMSAVNAPVLFCSGCGNFQVSVWTGNVLLVWGTDQTGNPSGGRYNPLTDSWTSITTVGAPTARVQAPTAVWTGRHMIVWGGADSSGKLNTGGRYDPIADTWSPTSTLLAPTGRTLHIAVWTGSRMVVWGGSTNAIIDPPVGLTDTGGRYDPASDTWSPTTTTNAPSGRSGHSAVWTGGQMVVWGGDNGASSQSTGGRYDPAANSWTATSTTGAPPGRANYSAVWTGTEMIVWGGLNTSNNQPYNTGGRYNPVTDSWTPTSTTGAPAARTFPSGVWDGARMIIWGGSIFTSNFGGRYDPASDTWNSTSSFGSNGRFGHAAVWSGAQMLIWGGLATGGGGYLNDGGRYFGDTVHLDLDQDGTTICGGDCNDGSSSVSPGATEVCNGIDDNCDGVVDENESVLCPADDDPCTLELCGGVDGCIHADAFDCSDDNACTVGDACQAGTCAPGIPVTCTPADSCHVAGTCDPATGMCSNPPAADGTPCSDGQSCTDGETCHAGACSGGALNQPPAISVSLSPTTLAANHKMIAIHATVVAQDACGVPLGVLLTSIVSSEPDDAPGPSDGHTTDDIQGASVGTADFDFLLRAERDSNGTGRIYTVTYTTQDSAMQTVSGSATVKVPLKKNDRTPTAQPVTKQRQSR